MDRRPTLACALWLGATVALAAGCTEPRAAQCGDGICSSGETPTSCAADCPVTCGDGVCTVPDESPETCPADCATCAPLTDVGHLIGAGSLFFGYAVLGSGDVDLGCGARPGAREVAVSFTPDFTGDLILSTVHPTDGADTVLEVRQDTCDGSALGCSSAVAEPGARVTIPVQSGQRYVALVETGDDEAGVFGLGLHRPGVCEGLGGVQDITADLLTGARPVVDTAASTSSLRGSCAAAEDNPEARLRLVAPRSGVMVASAIHPSTALDAVLHVREASAGGASFCDSPEAEVACAPGSGLVRFEVVAGRGYDLLVDGAGTGASRQGAATVTLGYAETSPLVGSLAGCDYETLADQIAFQATAGQVVAVRADTVDAATAADLRLRVRRPDGSELVEADDDFDCTFPPPQWSCPQAGFTADAAGLYLVEVYVGTSESCADRSRVGYALTVTVDEEPADLIQIRDQ